jgi:hypothetical protein
VVAVIVYHIVNCGDPVDRAADEVKGARRMPRREALTTLRELRNAKRYWGAGARLLTRPWRHTATLFSAARFDLEKLLGVKRARPSQRKLCPAGGRNGRTR